jgi:hypothetical protein
MRLPLLNCSTKPNEMKSPGTCSAPGHSASTRPRLACKLILPHIDLQHSKAWASAECAPAASQRGKDTAYRVRCGPCILGSMPWINTSGAGLQQQAQRASERRMLRWQDPCQMKRWGNWRGAMGTQSKTSGRRLRTANTTHQELIVFAEGQGDCKAAHLCRPRWAALTSTKQTRQVASLACMPLNSAA